MIVKFFKKMENIHVTLRVRPLNPKELSNKDECVWSMSPQQNLMEFKPKEFPSKASFFAKSAFTFDQHYTPTALNQDIYQKSVKPLILTSLEGINTTIFMYGQTGSGKTYTILGGKEFLKEEPNKTIPDKKDLGILLLSINELFESIRKDEEKTYMVKCSYVEIYNDNVFDLLKPLNNIRNENITINEDQHKEFFLKGMTEQWINSCDEIIEMLRLGEINRHYAETNMNHVSSRSHTIFRIAITTFTNNCIRSLRKETLKKNINNLNIVSQDKYNGFLDQEETLVTESFVNFVDLAGSEKVMNTNYEEDENKLNENNIGGFGGKEMTVNSFSSINREKRTREGQFINKSLFFLTQVIALKSEGKK